MPQLRGDQLKNLTIKDAQVANDAAIRQHKIDDSSGWISDGILHITNTVDQPIWNGDQDGKIYFLEDSQELVIGTSSTPYFTVIGKRGGRWNVKVTRKDGTEASDWDGNFGTEYVSAVPMKQDSSNSLVYINGILHRMGSNYDYTILPDNVTIKFNYTISNTDVITIVVYSDDDISSLLTDYVTKTELLIPTVGNSGAQLIGVSAINGITSNNLQDVLTEIEYKLDNSIKQYDHITTIKMGSDAINGNQFVSSGEFAVDGSNLFVYYNGQLQKNGIDDDYIIVDSYNIMFHDPVLASDRITITVMVNLSMSSYSTWMGLSSSINGYSGASRIGVTTSTHIASQNVQSVLEDISSGLYNLTSNLTITNNRLGVFNGLPKYALDITSSEKTYSKSGFITENKCVSQFFKSESNILVGDLVGVNPLSGYVRRYINGDIFVGIKILSPGVALGGNSDIEVDNTYSLVGIKGKMAFTDAQTTITNRQVFTKDNIRIGVQLADGEIFI